MINLNGELIEMSRNFGITFTTDNRAFNYGDGLFETIRMFDGKMPFLNHHFQRFKRGCTILQLHSSTITYEFFEAEIKKLQPSPHANLRIKWLAYRKAGGLYTPQSDDLDFLITATPLTDSQFNWKTLTVGVCKNVTLPCNLLSNIKTCNSLPYILAAKYSASNGWDDGIILNQYGRVAESTNANIFIIKNNTLITPSLDEGCLDGTTRKLILLLTQQIGIPTYETQLTLQDLLTADEVFLTNAIEGIKWVKEFQNKHYDNTVTKILFNHLNTLMNE